MRKAKRLGLLVTGILLLLSAKQPVTAEDAPPTLREKAAALLKLDVAGPTTYLYYPDNETYQTVWLRYRIGQMLSEKPNFGYSREQILRVKKFVCVDSQGIPGLQIYQAVAKWQAENEFVEDAQQTLREAVAFSKRLKANPPPKPRINGWCGCYVDMSPESRIVCEMLRVGSSDEDVLSAAAQITPDWNSLQYMEEPYRQLAAQLGRHDLALELVRRMKDPMQAAIHGERVAEEILHSGDHTLAKLAFEQTLDRMPDPKNHNWNRGGSSFPVRAAACLGHMGEYELAAKFLERAKEFPELRSTSLIVKNRAQQYLDQAVPGESKLPLITKDMPDYKQKVGDLLSQCEYLKEWVLPELTIDMLETIQDDPTRMAAVALYLSEWAEMRQELPEPLPPFAMEVLRKYVGMLPVNLRQDEKEVAGWNSAPESLAKLLIQLGMLEKYHDRFDPQLLAKILRDYADYHDTDYPAFGLYDALRYSQFDKWPLTTSEELLASKLRMWLPLAQNQKDAQRMAKLLLEMDPLVTDPKVYFLTGDDLLSRQMGALRMESKDYSVAGEKTEKDYYPLTDLLIETYLRGEDHLAGMIAVDIIERLWLLRDQKLDRDAGTRRHNEVVSALLILDDLRP